MKNWYLYYRLLRGLNYRGGTELQLARLHMQDVLIDLRTKAVAEWPGSTDQEIQDWFEYLAMNTNGKPMSQGAAERLTRMEDFTKNAIAREDAARDTTLPPEITPEHDTPFDDNEAADIQYRESMKDAGRGHLLR
jgi:hypothetical protein